MAGEIVLSVRQLNRAYLARQMLLARESVTPARAIERLVGMQAQQPGPPFVGLWSRIDGFERASLLEAFHNRKVVRATMMRATIHLASAKDYLAFRSSIQLALTAAMQSIVKARGASLEQEKVIAAAPHCFKQQPRTFVELRAALAKDFPDLDERAMGYLARTCIPLVMVPDDSENGFSGAQFADAEWWLGKPVSKEVRLEELVLRYLAAFGPATVRDAAAWSGIPKLDAAFAALRPKLLVFRDERKRELFDLPKAPRPDTGIAAPVRFVPAFDNLILSHADRSRIIADEYRPRVSTKNLQILPTFLVGGFVAGTWDVARKKKMATLTVSPFAPLSRPAKQELTDEAEKLVRFVGQDAVDFEVVFRPA